MVGAAGFEPTTPTPPAWCATRLRYAPNKVDYIRKSLKSKLLERFLLFKERGERHRVGIALPSLKTVCEVR